MQMDEEEQDKQTQVPDQPPEQTSEQAPSHAADVEQELEGMHIVVKDHLETPPEDECGYCSQLFGPDEVVVEKMIHGVKWRFCSEECCQDFIKDHDFADEDLDSKDVEEPPEIEDEEEEI
jgi:hypothetical protein